MSWCRLSNKRQSGIIPTIKHTPRIFMGQEVPPIASHYILHPDGTLGFIHKSFEGKARVCNQLTFGVEGVPINSTKFWGYSHLMEPLPNQESNNQQEKTEQSDTERENNMKEFTKADLRSGHKVKCRNGEIFTVFLNSSYEDLDVLVGDNFWTKFSRMRDDLTTPFSSDYDIMEVWSNPVYLLDSGNTCSLIWKREEKSPEQLAYEALQQKIAEHEQTMKELKEQAEKLKPKG